MDSVAFLQSAGKPLLPLYVVHGDELFLKRQVIKSIRLRALGSEADDGGSSVHAGDKAEFAEVFDDLQALPLFSPRRLVIVENAEPFVTRFRAALEKKVQHLPASGVLVIDVKSWQTNTRLYKLVGEAATVACKAPAASQLPQWCMGWARTQHQKELANPAARLLVDLIGPEMGLLDQEIQKLAIFVGGRSRIDSEDVDKLVGHSRTQNTWKIFDAIAAGRSGEAFTMLERLFDQGEEPMRILGAFSMQLRRLAQAGRLAQQGTPLRTALEQAGVHPYGIQSAEQQLRHLGRRRANRLYDWLLELDLGLKGGSPLLPRVLLERCIVKLARKE